MDEVIIYRWYWFIRSSPRDVHRSWVPTCWIAASKEGAEEVAIGEMYKADKGNKRSKLVRETTTYTDE